MTKAELEKKVEALTEKISNLNDELEKTEGELEEVKGELFCLVVRGGKLSAVRWEVVDYSDVYCRINALRNDGWHEWFDDILNACGLGDKYGYHHARTVAPGIEIRFDDGDVHIDFAADPPTDLRQVTSVLPRVRDFVSRYRLSIDFENLKKRQLAHETRILNEKKKIEEIEKTIKLFTDG